MQFSDLLRMVHGTMINTKRWRLQGTEDKERHASEGVLTEQRLERLP